MATMLKHLCVAFGTAFFYLALSVSLHFLAGAIDQPHPEYLEGNWMSHRLKGSLSIGVVLAVAIFMFVWIDLGVRHLRDGKTIHGFAYYPRFRRIKSWLLTPAVGLIWVSGLIALAIWYAMSAIEVYTVRQSAGGLVWPPERLFAVFLLAWVLCWLTDCWIDPANETVVAAWLFAVVAFLVTFPLSYGILRE